MNVRQSRLIQYTLTSLRLHMVCWWINVCKSANGGIHSSLRVLGGFSHFWVQNFTLLVDVGSDAQLSALHAR